MDCNKANELISLALDDMLSIEEEKTLQMHLETCESCKEDYQLYRSIQTTLQSEEAASLPDKFHDDLMERVASTVLEREEVRVDNDVDEHNDKVIELRRPFYKRFNYKQLNVAAVIVVVLVFGLIGINNLDSYIGVNESEMTKSAQPIEGQKEEAKMETTSEEVAEEAAEDATSEVEMEVAKEASLSVENKMVDRSKDADANNNFIDEATVAVQEADTGDVGTADIAQEPKPTVQDVSTESSPTALMMSEESQVEGGQEMDDQGQKAQPQAKMARDESGEEIILTGSEEPVAYDGLIEDEKQGEHWVGVLLGLFAFGLVATGVVLGINRLKK